MLSKIEAQQPAAFRVDDGGCAAAFTTGNILVREQAAWAKTKRVIPNALARCTP